MKLLFAILAAVICWCSPVRASARVLLRPVQWDIASRTLLVHAWTLDTACRPIGLVDVGWRPLESFDLLRDEVASGDAVGVPGDLVLSWTGRVPYTLLGNGTGRLWVACTESPVAVSDSLRWPSVLVHLPSAALVVAVACPVDTCSTLVCTVLLEGIGEATAMVLWAHHSAATPHVLLQPPTLVRLGGSSRNATSFVALRTMLSWKDTWRISVFLESRPVNTLTAAVPSVQSFVVGGDLAKREDCNDTLYRNDVLRSGDLSQAYFRFRWYHADVSGLALAWAFVCAMFQSILLAGQWRTRPSLFVLLVAIMLSMHMTLIVHMNFTTYALVTLAGLSFPLLSLAVYLLGWMCVHGRDRFKVPERAVVHDVVYSLGILATSTVFILLAVFSPLRHSSV